MRKYINNARGSHWLVILTLICIASYLPYLIFGAFPYNTKTNSNEIEMEQLLEGVESIDFYDKNEFLSISQEEIEREINAF